ncbi:hypothetical protein PT974_00796 [Cladobotryum mycophilum]|uniref:Uncharacterized protein n=1 Tax=Cladobotryum mycophilum TaxID=491253 RepID=A0ABR0T2Q2_9HYPO
MDVIVPNPVLVKKKGDPHPYFVKLLEEAMRKKQEPCFTEQLMIGPPETEWKQFCQPLLRRCPLLLGDVEKGSWKLLDKGMDACVWKFRTMGHWRTLKVFWDNEVPPVTNYWAFQRECHNATTLQAIEAAAEKATGTEGIWIHGQPKTHRQAVENLYAFSHQGSQKGRLKEVPGAIPFTAASIPRFKKCFGWLRVSCKELMELDGSSYPELYRADKEMRQMRRDQEYYSIVYEFIPEGENRLEAVQFQIDFFHRMGFSFCISPRCQNWTDSVLVDYSEIVSPGGYGWSRGLFERGVPATSQLNMRFIGPLPKPEGWDESDSYDTESSESDDEDQKQT